VKGVSDARGRVLASALSTMFSWLVEQRRLEVSPSLGVRPPPPSRPRHRVLSGDEIKLLWRATDTDSPLDACVRLLLLTGCRLREVADLTWDEVSADLTQINLSGDRTKNRRPHVVPLSSLARDILSSVPRVAGCRFAFTADGVGPRIGWHRHKAKLDRAVGFSDWVLHDLRRTVVTGMAELGVRPDVIEMAVNHISGARGGVAGTYNRAELLPERRQAIEAWSKKVIELVEERRSNRT
jgi:integrase